MSFTSISDLSNEDDRSTQGLDYNSKHSQSMSHHSHHQHQNSHQAPKHPHVDIVVASIKKDSTIWLSKAQLPAGWRPRIYAADDPDADLTVPKTNGRESMVYLTYIIDHYDSLLDYAIFRHSSRSQWHTDDPDYDGLSLLRRVQLPHLAARGYVDLRYTWKLGSPVAIRPFEDEGGNTEDENAAKAALYKRSFQGLLPFDDLPQAVGASCCATFAAARDLIRSRTLEEYVHMRNWLIDTDLADGVTGRIFEYLWHIIFRRDRCTARMCETAIARLSGFANLPVTRDSAITGGIYRRAVPFLSSGPRQAGMANPGGLEA